MSLGELLDEIRAHYLDRFRDAIREQESQPDVEVVIESPYLDASGEPVREGALSLPTRGDLFVLRDGEVTEALQVETETMLAFDAVSFEWGESLRVELCPFQWNWCPLALTPAPSLEELAPVVHWFERWFEETEDTSEGEPPLARAVHFLSEPDARDEQCHLDLDLGSAPVQAFEELLDACAEVGAAHLRIGEEDEPAT